MTLQAWFSLFAISWTGAGLIFLFTGEFRAAGASMCIANAFLWFRCILYQECLEEKQGKP